MKPLLVLFIALVIFTNAKKSKEGEKPDWAKKNIMDMSDADLERLLDQWDEDEEPIPPDELPEVGVCVLVKEFLTLILNFITFVDLISNLFIF